MNTLVKYLAHLPSHEVAFFRGLIALIFCTAWMKYKKIPFKGNNNLLLFVRGAAGTLALLCYFYSIHTLPLGTAVVLQNLSPLFATVVAMLFFKESTQLLQWVLVFVAFAGVMLVKGFDGNVSWFNLVVGVAGAVLSAFAYNFVRKLKDSDPPERVVFYFPLTSVVLIFPMLFWKFTMPTLYDFVLLTGVGVVTHFAQIYMTKAYHADKASKISIYNYLGVPIMLFVGWIFFDEILNFQAMFGIILILGATTFSGLSQVKVFKHK